MAAEESETLNGSRKPAGAAVRRSGGGEQLWREVISQCAMSGLTQVELRRRRGLSTWVLNRRKRRDASNE